MEKERLSFDLDTYNDTVKRTVEQRLGFEHNSTGGKQKQCACGQRKGNDCKFYYKQESGTYKCFHQNKCGLPSLTGNYHDLNKHLGIVSKEEVKEAIPEEKKIRKTNTAEPDYIYRYSDGNIAYGVKRYEWKDQETGKKQKSFNPAYKNTEGNWEIVRTKAENYEEQKQTFAKIPKVLYNSDKIAKAKYIWIVEGEKCADRLQKEFDGFVLDEYNTGTFAYQLGDHAVVTNIHGAGKWREEYTFQIKELAPNATLIILPDNDEAGKRHARDIWESLGKLPKVIIPGGLETKQDIFDWLEMGCDIAQLCFYADENTEEMNAIHDFLQDDYWEKPQNNSNPKEDKLYELNEVGSCDRFLDMFGDDFIYVKKIGWYFWNKTHWEEDESGAKVKQRIIESLYALRAYELTLGEEQRADKIKIRNFYNVSMTERKITAVMKIAETNPKVRRNANVLNNKPDYLNVENGVLDLRSGIILPHDKKYYFTRVIPVAYPRIGKGLPLNAPIWKDFLATTFLQNQELIEYIQIMMGYSLTGLTKEQCVFFMTGTGRNGKSTFIKVLQQLLGGYYKKLNTESLMDRNNVSPINNDIARLYDSRLVVCSEVEEGRMWNQALMKDLSGGDEISARFMRQEYFDFMPQFKLWIYGNYKPTLKGLDEGTKRRFRILPFDAKIELEKVKKDLDEQLKTELPQILAWTVDGAVKYYKHKEKGLAIKIPEVVSKATEDYFIDNDPLFAWLEDYFGNEGSLMLELPDKISKKELYKSYKEHAEEVGNKAFGDKAFTRKMKDHGLVDKVIWLDGKSIRGFSGLSILREKFLARQEKNVEDFE